MDMHALYVARREDLLAFPTRRTADPEIALDLLAETFAQAYASRGGFRGEDAGAWLDGIAKKQLALYQRQSAADAEHPGPRP